MPKRDNELKKLDDSYFPKKERGGYGKYKGEEIKKVIRTKEE